MQFQKLISIWVIRWKKLYSDSGLELWALFTNSNRGVHGVCMCEDRDKGNLEAEDYYYVCIFIKIPSNPPAFKHIWLDVYFVSVKMILKIS